MSGGASILPLPYVEDEEEEPSKVRSTYKPAVSLSAKSKVETPQPKPIRYEYLATPGEIDFYARLKQGGMTDEEIVAKHPELLKVKEKKERDRFIQEMANRPEPME